jgi:hypothetical protein
MPKYGNHLTAASDGRKLMPYVHKIHVEEV